MLRRRLEELERQIRERLEGNDVGKLLTTIPGVGPQTAAELLAELGDPGQFSSAKAVAAYVGVVPGLRQSGQRRSPRAHLHPVGHARLRRVLWLPALTAVQYNPVLGKFYRRLVARGKPHKVALIAVIHKLLHIVYAVARDHRPFTVPATA